jgi:hypothetical protein
MKVCNSYNKKFNKPRMKEDNLLVYAYNQSQFINTLFYLDAYPCRICLIIFNELFYKKNYQMFCIPIIYNYID